MKEFKGKSLSDRLQNANQAKQAMLKRMQAMPKADDPAVIERKAAQRAASEASKAKRLEHEEAKALAARLQAEREASEKAEQLALEKRKAREEADRLVALKAEQKAARDARYAARKKRKG